LEHNTFSASNFEKPYEPVGDGMSPALRRQAETALVLVLKAVFFGNSCPGVLVCYYDFFPFVGAGLVALIAQRDGRCLEWLHTLTVYVKAIAEPIRNGDGQIERCGYEVSAIWKKEVELPASVQKFVEVLKESANSALAEPCEPGSIPQPTQKKESFRK
jgi:hypothetical protein